MWDWNSRSNCEQIQTCSEFGTKDM